MSSQLCQSKDDSARSAGNSHHALAPPQQWHSVTGTYIATRVFTCSWVVAWWHACRLIRRALRHQLRQVGSDGPRPAADIQDAHVRPQRWQQVAGAVGGGARRVRAQHALAVAVDVGGGLWPRKQHMRQARRSLAAVAAPFTIFPLHTQAEVRLVAARKATVALHKAPSVKLMSKLGLPTFASFLVSAVRAPAPEAEALILESAVAQSA